MTEEAQWIKSILPSHYTCEPLGNGIYCYSNNSIGIDDDDKEWWDYIVKAIKQKFGTRFKEIYHQTNTNHLRFTVFLKK